MPPSGATAAVAASLSRMFGSLVDVRYYDAGEPEVQADHAAMLAHFEEEGWPLPVATLDGSVLAVGRIQPLKLVAAIAAELARAGHPAGRD